MDRKFQVPITYFFEEGKSNLRDCLAVSFEAAVAHDIKKIVIFTGVGEGVKIALEEFTTQPQYSGIELVAVTFPAGRVAAKFSDEDLAFFASRNVPLVRAHLPFGPINGTFQERGIGQGLALLGSVLEAFCGSMSLCVQAVLMACDAGIVEDGEHVISLTSDTAILVRSCRTAKFLSHFIIREILCKPVLLTIGKKEGNHQQEIHVEDDQSGLQAEQDKAKPKILPPEK